VADWHLAELEVALQRAGWSIASVEGGDDYRVSATWTIVRGEQQRRLVFEGLTDAGTALPIERAYACAVEGAGLSLYFGRKSRSRWPRELESFVAALGPR
jgi:hypothetical protein